jgi:hypothetical protein
MGTHKTGSNTNENPATQTIPMFEGEGKQKEPLVARQGRQNTSRHTKIARQGAIRLNSTQKQQRKNLGSRGRGLDDLNGAKVSLREGGGGRREGERESAREIIRNGISSADILKSQRLSTRTLKDKALCTVEITHFVL